MGDSLHKAQKGSRRPHVRRAVFALVLGTLCAAPVALLIGASSDAYLTELPFLDIADGNRRLGGFVFAGIAFVAVAAFSYAAFERIPLWAEHARKRHLPRLLRTEFTRRGILYTAGIIFVCWIPALIVLFPVATTTYDTIDELYQALSQPPLWYFSTNEVIDASIIDHHPWFDTIVFGAFAWLGRTFGSDAAGLFLYGVVQTAASALILGASICYLGRLRVPPLWRLCALIFVVLFPAFPATADSMQKDSLFALAFLVYVLMYLETFRTSGQALRSKRFLACFMIVTALCILTKKMGVFITGASTIVLIAALRHVRLRSLASFAIPALTSLVLLPALLFPMLSIAPGGSQEALGIMYQQSITVLKESPGSVTAEERAAIDAVLDVDRALANYRPDSTDYVKRWAKPASGQEHAAYLSAWARMGLANPGAYLASIARCTAPLLVPSEPLILNWGVSAKGIAYYEEHDAAIGGSFHLDAASPRETQQIAAACASAYASLQTVPVLSLICTMGFYDAWIPLFALACALYGRRRRDAVALAPVIACAVLLAASPTPLARYALCMVFIALPTIGWAIRSLRGPKHAPRTSEKG